MSYKPQDTKLYRPAGNPDRVCCLIGPLDYNVAVQVAQHRWCSSKPGYFGRGQANTQADPFRVERCGLLGEIGLAQYLNQEVDLDFQPGGDQYDFLVGDQTLNLKTALQNRGNGVVRQTNQQGLTLKFKQDLYGFAYLHGENHDKAIVVLVGFCTREFLKQQPLCTGKGGHHLNREVQYADLCNIQGLLEPSR